MKLGRPSHTTIWHRPCFFFFEIRLKIFEIWSILWRHYTPLLVENWPNFAGLWKTQFLMKTQIENTKRRKMRSSTRWLSRFFSKFWVFEPKSFKKSIFWGKWSQKSKIFNFFTKTVTYVIHLLVVYQCTQFQVNSSIFDPQMECFCLRNHTHLRRHFFKCDFCNFWGSYAKTNDTIRFLSQNWSRSIHFLSIFINLKIWPFLTWPWSDLRWKHLKTASDDQNDVAIELYGQYWP